MESLFIFFAAVLTSLLITATTKSFALKHHIGSYPDNRKIHSGFIPSMGGLGIFVGGLAGVAISLLWKEYYWEMFSLKYVGIAIGSLIMLATGMIDDLRGLKAVHKFGAQIIAATFVIVFGCRIETILNPFGAPIELGVFSVPLTFLWLVWVTNSFNLLDGLDGLAAGVGTIVMTTFAALAFSEQDWMTFAVCLAVIGGILGFIKYNYHPAVIFMGDTGSLFLGFIVASISLRGLQSSEGNISLLVPLVALALPLGDSMLAVLRRLIRGFHPFQADKDHLHHRLIYLGLTHRQAVHIIYAISLLFAVSAYIMSWQESIYIVVLPLITLALVLFGINRLGYVEAQRDKTYLGDQTMIRVSKALAPISLRRIWHKLLLIFADAAAINVTLLFTIWFRFYSGVITGAASMNPEFYLSSSISFVVTVYFLLLFALNGLYGLRWDVSRFDMIIRVSKVILFGGVLIFLLTFEPERIFSLSRMTLVVFIAALIATVSFFRLVLIQVEKQFSVLEYALHPTVLVGTSRGAQKMIKDIEKNPHLLYDIKGFVAQTDEKKEFMGYKYLGHYKDLAEVIRKYNIEEVIIAIQERSRDEVLRIIAAAENLRVSFKIIPQMYDVISGHKTREVLGHPLMQLFPDQMLPWQWLIKRVIDITGSAIALLLLSPFFLIAFLLQSLAGIYPFFAIENRIGKQGRIFGQLLLNIPDKKSTVGKILYRSYIFKLPQLVNVLLGSMALVGPRPESVELVEDLRRKIKFYNRRFLVRPGVTGWTQVRYRYSESLKHLKEQFKHDLYYLENMSVFFDLRILVRSLYILFFRR